MTAMSAERSQSSLSRSLKKLIDPHRKSRICTRDESRDCQERTIVKRRIKSMLALALLSPSLSWAACDVQSGPRTTALIELYTSEGCSSCPPADKRLSQFPSGDYGLAQAVPISLHVDYWDDLGWKEPFAQAQFSERQSWLVHANGHKTVFTPHFFVSGTEVRDWRSDLADQLKRVNAQAAGADIHLRSESGAQGTFVVSASASAPASADSAALFVAVTEDKLTSRVSAGENRGATLSHDHVVRQWIGPIALRAGHADVRQAITSGANWNPANLGIVGFVQDMKTGHVLQAVAASECVRS